MGAATGLAGFLFVVAFVAFVAAVSNGLVFGDMDDGEPGMFSNRADGSSS